MPRDLTVRFVLTCAAIALSSCAAVAQRGGVTRPVAITHVSVVDVTTGALLADQSVIINGDRISLMGSASTTRPLAGTTIVDGTGKFLIPGLWDMHSHLFANSDRDGAELHAYAFPLYIANGVTGVRDMWTTLEELPIESGWNRAEASGTLIGPRLVPTSTMLAGSTIGENHKLVVTTPDQARRVVDSLVAGGARTIKVQNGLSRDVYFAIAERAKHDQVDFVGHVGAAITIRDAADAGQRSIEHNGGVPDGCSSQEAEIMRRRNAPAAGRGVNIGEFVRATYDDSTCRALGRYLVAHDTWLVPTSVVKTIGLPDDSLRTGHRGYAYTPADERAAWTSRPTPSAGAVAGTRANNAGGWKIIGLMNHEGVSIMAGTDVGNHWLAFGFSLQDELALMAASGLSPLEALRTATLNPARFLHATDSLGSVAPGKIADLVLLDANPLLDIHNTRRIFAVVARGRVYDRARLDSLLLLAKGVVDAMK